jgi:hypothetical protein
MSILGRLANYIIHGGSWVVRPYECGIIEAVAKSLPSSDGENLLLQLKFLDHIKRHHQDRMVNFYFEFSNEAFPYLQKREPGLPLAKLSIQSSKGNFSVLVVAHRGALSSLEFKRSPSHLRREKLIITKIQTLDVPLSNLPEEIDRAEHGMGRPQI